MSELERLKHSSPARALLENRDGSFAKLFADRGRRPSDFAKTHQSTTAVFDTSFGPRLQNESAPLRPPSSTDLNPASVLTSATGPNVGPIRSTDRVPPATNERIARFEQLGEDQVRDLVEDWCPPLSSQGRAWLKMKREAVAQVEEVARNEQALLARRALRWAIISSMIATTSVAVLLMYIVINQI